MFCLSPIADKLQGRARISWYSAAHRKAKREALRSGKSDFEALEAAKAAGKEAYAMSKVAYTMS